MKKLNDYINSYENSFLQSAKIDNETIRKLKTLYELILKNCSWNEG